MIFYRYVRPVRFDSKRVEVQTFSRGGVCLRFEAHANETLFFTHSRCHPDELFSKDIARKIADHRAESMASVIKNEMQLVLTEPSFLIEDVIEWCSNWDPVPYPPIVSYAQDELRQLGSILSAIVNVNLQERQKMQDWVTIQSAANFQDNYDRLSR